MKATGCWVCSTGGRGVSLSFVFVRRGMLCLLISVGLFVVRPVRAQMEQVTLDLNSGQQHLIRNDYEGAASNMSLAVLIGNQVPPGSQFIQFDTNAQAYLPTITQDRYGSWGPAGTTVLARGVAYWLRIPPQGGVVASNQYHVTLAGTIPAGDTTITVSSNFNALGYPYPVDGIWGQTALAATCPNGSYVYFWDTTLQYFSSGVKSTKDGAWPPYMATKSLQAGEGFFFRLVGTNVLNVVEPLPY